MGEKASPELAAQLDSMASKSTSRGNIAPPSLAAELDAMHAAQSARGSGAALAQDSTARNVVGSVMSALQGLTLNHADEASAAMESAFTGKPYDKSHAEWEKMYGMASNEHPVAGIVGASYLPIPGSGAESSLGRIGLTALSGAGMGAAQYEGSQSKLADVDPAELLKQAGEGAAIFGGGQAVAEGLGAASMKAAGAAEQAGSKATALKAAGFSPGQTLEGVVKGAASRNAPAVVAGAIGAASMPGLGRAGVGYGVAKAGIDIARGVAKSPLAQQSTFQLVSKALEMGTYLGHATPAIAKAIQNGDEGEFNARHYVLSTSDPEYQSAVQKLREEDNETPSPQKLHDEP